jgi:hypothetical protein
MLSRRTLICLLVLANGILAAAMLASLPDSTPAFAQAGIRSGAYLSVTANADGQTYDAVWVLDLANDKLYAFYPQVPYQRPLVASAPRDLAADFGKAVP